MGLPGQTGAPASLSRGRQRARHRGPTGRTADRGHRLGHTIADLATETEHSVVHVTVVTVVVIGLLLLLLYRSLMLAVTVLGMVGIALGLALRWSPVPAPTTSCRSRRSARS